VIFKPSYSHVSACIVLITGWGFGAGGGGRLTKTDIRARIFGQNLTIRCHLEGFGADGIILKLFWKKVERCLSDSSGSVWGSVEGSCQHCNRNICSENARN